MKLKTVFASAGGLVVAVLVVTLIVVLARDRAHERDRVHQLEKELVTARRAADDGGRAAAAAKDQLASTQRDLDAIKATVAQQSGQIDVLKGCLNGVSRFFDKASAGDQQGAVAALNAVQAQCDQADKLLPQ